MLVDNFLKTMELYSESLRFQDMSQFYKIKIMRGFEITQ